MWNLQTHVGKQARTHISTNVPFWDEIPFEVFDHPSFELGHLTMIEYYSLLNEIGPIVTHLCTLTFC